MSHVCDRLDVYFIWIPENHKICYLFIWNIHRTDTIISDALIQMKILYIFLCRFAWKYFEAMKKGKKFYLYKFSVDFITCVCVVVVRVVLNQGTIFYIESDIITYLNLFRHFYLLMCTYMVYLINKILNWVLWKLNLFPLTTWNS